MRMTLGVMAVVLAGAIAVPAMAHDRTGERFRSGPRMSATEIRRIQEKLDEMGYPVGRADGVMGPKTETALRNFQRDKGLNATGEFNDETLAALDLDGRGATAGTSAGTRTSAAEIRRIQEKLDRMGYQAGPADGVMGRRTETALRNFQRDKGLNATGEINDETLAGLDGERRGATAGTRSH